MGEALWSKTPHEAGGAAATIAWGGWEVGLRLPGCQGSGGGLCVCRDLLPRLSLPVPRLPLLANGFLTNAAAEKIHVKSLASGHGAPGPGAGGRAAEGLATQGGGRHGRRSGAQWGAAGSGSSVAASRPFITAPAEDVL